MGQSASQTEEEEEEAPPSPTAQVPRAELLRRAFQMYDIDADGLLNLAEIQSFARDAGLAEDDAAWKEAVKAYDEMCKKNYSAPHKGVDEKLFAWFVDNELISKQLCSDEQIESLLKRSQQNSASANKLLDQSSRPPRSLLERLAFNACDLDRDERLNETEMRLFLRHTGFAEAVSDTDWANDYQRLCSEIGCDPESGIDRVLFSRLVSDDSEDCGCYCTDRELQVVIDKLLDDKQERPPVKPTVENVAGEGGAHSMDSDGSRKSTLRALFSKFDADLDGYLNQIEMGCFAERAGFIGSDDNWPETYRLMCSECGCDASTGIDLAELTKLVDEECTDDDLVSMLSAA
eukprot:TRINITY_DN65245_c0_g1_i1.p1 TRINITY_DN65245_c0_g1~~TRINITY_DN65245_c0_g1_i1.p1  ORF type:complete len:354 (-),score=69.49 TRINITY_DN65245_c0_g1_i1:116-1156(-)